MEEGQKKIIQEHFEELLHDLEPKQLVSFLFQEKILTQDDMETIHSIKANQEKSEALLVMLLRKGPSAFLALVEGLIKHKKWLATLLLQEG